MKILILLLIALYTNSMFCQQYTDTTKFRDSGNYEEAINYYLAKTDLNQSDFYNFYQVACYYSLTKNNVLSYKYLRLAIKKGAKGENVLTDTDFNNLKNDSLKWCEINDLIKIQYLKNNPNIKKQELGYELWLMWVEDQRFRTLGRNYKLKQKPAITLNKNALRLKRLIEIIEDTGWPKYSDVGKTGGDAAFYVLQHSDNKYMKKYISDFIKTGKLGEADIGKAAMMIDRILTNTENVQIYGSQAIGRWKNDTLFEAIDFHLVPIADEENVIKRREKLGMSEFYSNCRRIGVEYIPIKDRKDYKYIPLKKKWFRKGYILVN